MSSQRFATRFAPVVVLALVAGACDERTVVTARYEDGSLATRVEMRGALREGVSTRRHPRGAIAEEAHYVEGLRDGAYTSWYRNGVRFQSGQYSRGRKTGTWHEWAPEGHETATGSYVADGRDGEWREFDARGAVVAIETWRAGTRLTRREFAPVGPRDASAPTETPRGGSDSSEPPR